MGDKHNIICGYMKHSHVGASNKVASPLATHDMGHDWRGGWNKMLPKVLGIYSNIFGNIKLINSKGV